MLSVGTVLQVRYRIAAHLGGGGFGDVYRAWQLSLNAPVAIKGMVPQLGLDAAMLARLRAQFQQAAVLIARQGALSESQVLAWADQLLDALAYCHGRGVIHRHVEPQNVIVRPGGQAVLVGFGLVNVLYSCTSTSKEAR